MSKKELFGKIWGIADDLRGKIENNDFKQYVLGFLFYRYISENITNYINDNEKQTSPNFDYSKLEDNKITNEIKNNIIEEKGFFIYPSELLKNVYERNKSDSSNLNIELNEIFENIENRIEGYNSKENFRNLLTDIDLDWNYLGKTVIEKNKFLSKIIKSILDLDLGDFHNSDIDILGDAYEYLIGMYASEAGKSGGEFFTPQEVSKLLTKLVISKQEFGKSIKVYDPACGSGSLLLQVKKNIDNDSTINFFGQESNPTTYNLCRMNMFLHNINYSKFDIRHGDTLIDPEHINEKFDIIVSNPPYSIKWIGDGDPNLINDVRYNPAGFLAPKRYADFAFVMHILYSLKEKKRAAIVCFPGIFYRGSSKAEKNIRKYLIENKFIEGIIKLPSNLFYGTDIQTDILIISKKNNEQIQFIDASTFYVKDTNQDKLSDKNINDILKIFEDKKNILNFSKLVSIEDVQKNNYNLSVNKYIDYNNKIDFVDINKLNSSIKEITILNNKLREDIDLIIQEIENE